MQKFHLKVASREGVIFEGEAASVSSYNDKGKFDVLPNHTNFISLIKKNLTIMEDDTKGGKNLKFENALMRVKENKVEVYLGVDNARKKLPS